MGGGQGGQCEPLPPVGGPQTAEKMSHACVRMYAVFFLKEPKGIIMVVWVDIFPTEIPIEVILKGLTRAIGKGLVFVLYFTTDISILRISIHLRTMLPFVHITFTLHVC